MAIHRLVTLQNIIFWGIKKNHLCRPHFAYLKVPYKVTFEYNPAQSTGPRSKTAHYDHHTDDASLPRSGLCFWLVESNFPLGTTDQKHDQDLGSDASSVMDFLRSFLRRHLAGKPVVASPNVGCFLRLSRRRGSPISFSGCGICVIWGSGFGILKGNRGEIRDWKYAREVGCQKQPSGLRDCPKI